MPRRPVRRQIACVDVNVLTGDILAVWSVPFSACLRAQERQSTKPGISGACALEPYGAGTRAHSRATARAALAWV